MYTSQCRTPSGCSFLLTLESYCQGLKWILGSDKSLNSPLQKGYEFWCVFVCGRQESGVESGVRVINHGVDGDLAGIVVGDGWPVSLCAPTSRWSPGEFSSALQPKAFSLRMDWVHLNRAPTHTFRNTSSNAVFCLVISFPRLWESATDSSVYKTAKLSAKSAPIPVSL